jgi:hypothetical protein
MICKLLFFNFRHKHPYRESNPDKKFRKLALCPLSYRG